jgi:hypothetical protein
MNKHNGCLRFGYEIVPFCCNLMRGEWDSTNSMLSVKYSDSKSKSLIIVNLFFVEPYAEVHLILQWLELIEVIEPQEFD